MLDAPHARVQAVLGEQRVVATGFDNRPIVQDQYPISMHDGRKPVRNNEGREAARDFDETSQDLIFRSAV